MLPATFQNTEVDKLVSYPPADFMYRLKCLRNICLHKEIEGILIINGPHGGENEEASKLTNWLFQGYTGHK
jgi:hypothetical protein